MTASWRARNALISTFLGWGSAWILTALFLGYSRLTSRFPDHTSMSDRLGILTIYLVATAIVTFCVSVIFVVPYCSLRSSSSILRYPWRMYIEPAFLGAICISLFNIRYGPSADTLRQKLASPFLGFALVTSLFASFFFLRRLRTRVSEEQKG